MERSICYEWLRLQLYSCRACDLCMQPGKIQSLPFSILLVEDSQNDRCGKSNRVLKLLHTACGQSRSQL